MRRSTLFPQFAGPAEQPLPYTPIGVARLTSHTPSSVQFQSGTTTVEVTALAPDLLRVGMFTEGRPVTYRSEAVARDDWPAIQATVTATATDVTLDTGTPPPP